MQENWVKEGGGHLLEGGIFLRTYSTTICLQLTWH